MGNKSVSYFVPLVAQPTDTSCWAAALDMVVSYRDQASYSVDYIASRAEMSLDQGYSWSDIQRAVAAWGLTQEGPASGTVDYWTNQLQQFGPIWIVEIGNPFHAVVLTGISGDDDHIGAATVSVNNPAPVRQGQSEQLSFLDFESDFELGSRANAAMVHA